MPLVCWAGGAACELERRKRFVMVRLKLLVELRRVERRERGLVERSWSQSEG